MLYASRACSVKARLLPATPPDRPGPVAVLVEADAAPGATRKKDGQLSRHI